MLAAGYTARENALKSEKLYGEMRAAGYEDNEFPVWWFSPARGEGQLTQVDEVGEVRSQVDEVGEVRSQVDEVGEVLDEVPPRIPAPKEDRITRPDLT
jgi:hypothetical protein